MLPTNATSLPGSNYLGYTQTWVYDTLRGAAALPLSVSMLVTANIPSPGVYMLTGGAQYSINAGTTFYSLAISSTINNYEVQSTNQTACNLNSALTLKIQVFRIATVTSASMVGGVCPFYLLCNGNGTGNTVATTTTVLPFITAVRIA
jgi:hypothetical protein